MYAINQVRSVKGLKGLFTVLLLETPSFTHQDKLVNGLIGNKCLVRRPVSSAKMTSEFSRFLRELYLDVLSVILKTQ